MNDELITYIAQHIGQETLNKMRQWFTDNPIEIYWHYDDKLTNEQVDMLMLGKHWQVYDDIWDNFMLYNDFMWEQQLECTVECVREHVNEILAGLTIDVNDMDDDDLLHTIVEEHELIADTIIDFNINTLIHNTRPRITLDLEPEHLYMPTTYYDEAEEILKFFNVNPRTMYELINGHPDQWLNESDDEEPPWPDMPERNGHEYVDAKELLDSWYNCPYSGNYVALLGGSIDLLKLAKSIEESDFDGKYLEVTLHPGTPILTHCYWPGSGGTEIYLKKEMKVRAEKINQLCRDGAFGYGVQEVHGLVYRVWDNEFDFAVRDESNEQQTERVL